MPAVDKDIRKLLKAAEGQGATVRRTTKNHFIVQLPDGSLVTVAGTPRNPRRTKTNLVVRLRNGGISV